MIAVSTGALPQVSTVTLLRVAVAGKLYQMLLLCVVQVLAGSPASLVAIVVSLASVNGQALIVIALAQLSLAGAAATAFGACVLGVLYSGLVSDRLTSCAG